MVVSSVIWYNHLQCICSDMYVEMCRKNFKFVFLGYLHTCYKNQYPGHMCYDLKVVPETLL